MKTLKISEELHKEVKVFCATNGLKMNDWVEKELKKILNGYDSNSTTGNKVKSI
jgi:predicted HicB family RNase H-like nuclease